jgi:blue copper oxidase
MPMQYRRRFIKAIASGLVLGPASVSRAANHADHAGHIPRHRAKDNGNVARPQPNIPIRVSTVAPFATPLRIPGAVGHFAQLTADTPLRLTAKIVRQPIFGGDSSDLWVYEASVGGQILWNPFLRLKKGSSVSAVLQNQLGEDTTIHWHGLHLDEKNDGGGMHPVRHTQSYIYRFNVTNRAGLYWYHAHPHFRTGAQIHKGMAGGMLIEDDNDDELRKSLGLEWGVTELPLVIQDKQIDARNKLRYERNEDDWIGNRVAVNWTLEPFHNTATSLYRIRILNASNARPYRLAFTVGKTSLPYWLIGTDGGLLEKPQPITELYLAPAQRADVLVDFSKLKLGDTVMLRSLAFDPMENDPAAQFADPALDHPNTPPLGEALDIVKFNIKISANKAYTLPKTFESFKTLPITARAIRRSFRLHSDGTRWYINGTNYLQTMHAIAATIKRNSVEIWEIKNEIQSMPHPMHLHGFHFRVRQRTGSPKQIKQLAVTSTGLTPHDLGWLDTVLVWPGEIVTVAVDFTQPFSGDQVYMFHCHNLEHEDQGMMLNIKVVA